MRGKIRFTIGSPVAQADMAVNNLTHAHTSHARTGTYAFLDDHRRLSFIRPSNQT